MIPLNVDLPAVLGLIALYSLVINGLDFVNATCDYIWLKRRKLNGLRSLVIRIHLRTSFFRCIMGMVLLGVGVFAKPAADYILFALILDACTLSVAGSLDRLNRSELASRIAKIQEGL